MDILDDNKEEYLRQARKLVAELEEGNSDEASRLIDDIAKLLDPIFMGVTPGSGPAHLPARGRGDRQHRRRCDDRISGGFQIVRDDRQRYPGCQRTSTSCH